MVLRVMLLAATLLLSLSTQVDSASFADLRPCESRVPGVEATLVQPAPEPERTAAENTDRNPDEDELAMAESGDGCRQRWEPVGYMGLYLRRLEPPGFDVPRRPPR